MEYKEIYPLDMLGMVVYWANVDIASVDGVRLYAGVIEAISKNENDGMLVYQVRTRARAKYNNVNGGIWWDTGAGKLYTNCRFGRDIFFTKEEAVRDILEKLEKNARFWTKAPDFKLGR